MLIHDHFQSDPTCKTVTWSRQYQESHREPVKTHLIDKMLFFSTKYHSQNISVGLDPTFTTSKTMLPSINQLGNYQSYIELIGSNWFQIKNITLSSKGSMFNV